MCHCQLILRALFVVVAVVLAVGLSTVASVVASVMASYLEEDMEIISNQPCKIKI